MPLKRYLPFALCLFWNWASPVAQATAGFAELVFVGHDCGSGGVAEYALVGDPATYTYRWAHGPQTLRLEGLAPGTYTFIVRNYLGCEETYMVEILDLGKCDALVDFYGGLSKCNGYLVVTPYNPETGQLYDASFTTITWHDGDPSGLTRSVQVDADEGVTYGFTISVADANSTVCCTHSGAYTVQPDRDCEEDFDCEVKVEVTPVAGTRCAVLVTVTVLDSNGEPVPEAEIEVFWSDGPSQSLVRLFYQTPSAYQVSVGVRSPLFCGNAEFFNTDITIPGNSRCRGTVVPPDKEKIIVNEMGKYRESGQFVELLVIGDRTCGGTTDIRGLILDDNNGELVTAGALVHQFNRQQVGIDPGYWEFAFHDNWAAVPNGSLIVVYNDAAATFQGFNIPADDPYDANQDGVYVLPAGYAGLFRGKTSSWDAAGRLERYAGVFADADWDKINLSSPADGLQVRTQEGLFIHGISTGTSPYQAEANDFQLWLGTLATDAALCAFTKTDYYNKEHFECHGDPETWATPGVPNSPENLALIERLTDCDGENRQLRQAWTPPAEGQLPLAEGNGLSAYPNPFVGQCSLLLSSASEGNATISVYNTSAGLILLENIRLEAGTTVSHTPQLPAGLPAGVYWAKTTFPDGGTRYLKIVKISY